MAACFVVDLWPGKAYSFYTLSRVAATIFLALVLAVPAPASGVFDGTANLYTNNALFGGTPTYPAMAAAWINTDQVASFTGWASVADNSATATELSCGFDGTDTSPPDSITGRAGSGGVFATQSEAGSITAGTWYHVVVVWTSTSVRNSYINGTVGTAGSGTSNPTGLDHSCVGAIYRAAAVAPFDGKIAEVVFASGFNDANKATIVSQLASGKRPTSVTELSGFINAYQPLRTGLNDTGYLGPDWTNTNVTFDAADHPISSGLLKTLLLNSQVSPLERRKQVPILHESHYALAP